MINFNRADLELVARGQQKRNKSLDSIREFLEREPNNDEFINSLL